MNEVECEKCGGKWDEPENFDQLVFETVCNMFRSNNIFKGIAYLRENTEVSLKGAKGIYHHTTKEKGNCHKCNAMLTDKQKTVCGICKSVNYDW